MENIDRIFFINLERRKDRFEQILTELIRMDIGHISERFEAVDIREFPALGCTKSHLEILKIAKERAYKNILIFEDDFQFIVDKETFQKSLKEFFNKHYDFKIIMLSYNHFNQTNIDNLVSTTNNSQTTSGFIVNSKYFDELIECISYGCRMLEKTKMTWLYTIDQIWKNLQQDNKWYIFNKRIGIQRESYSDLTNSVVSYGV